MSFWIQGLRALQVWCLAIWLGGFTFYSAVVIPGLHEQLGGPMETGLVTQQVTNYLNLIGLVTIVIGAVGLAGERIAGADRRASSLPAILLLGLTSGCLVALYWLHHLLDQKLDAGTLTGFYTLHRVYLWVSVLQWLANLGLLACWAGVIGGGATLNPAQEDSSFRGTDRA
ncbi:MAG: hypothetical protein U0790_28160 [Isosphaeraceae bacterium]